MVNPFGLAAPIREVFRTPATPRYLIWGIAALLLFNLLRAGAATNDLASASVAGKPGHMVFGGDQDYPPFEWLDKSGRPQGFNVDLIRAVGKVMGYEVEVRLGPWPQIRQALEHDGTVDVSDMFFTEEQAKTASFSTPFWEVHDEIFVRSGTRTIDTLDELAGREVLCQRGSTAEDLLRRTVPTVKLITVASEPEALRRLASGQYDYAVIASVIGRYTIRQNELRNLTTTGPPLWPRNYCLVTAKNHPQLLTDLNEGLAILKRTGRFDEIYDKWFAAFQPRKPWLNKLLALLPWITTVLAALTVAVTAWIWILRHTVRLRTRELRQSSEQMRLIMENLADLVAVLDLAGHRIYNSPSYRGILGDPGKLRGSSSFDQIHADDRARVQRAFQETVRTGVGERLEYRLVAPTGETRHIESQGSVIRDAQGQVSQVIVVSRDVTERRESERALRESEQKYRELVMLANSIILRMSRDGRIIFLNEFGQRFFGYTEADICGRHVVGTIVPPGEIGGRHLPSMMEEICANPAAFEQNENENMRSNGEHVWIAWTNRVVLDERGQPAEILSIGVDITARKRIEEELRATQASLEQRVFLRTTELAEAKERAESADRLKSAFLATMSHELRTPLNSIIGFTGIMLQGLTGSLNAEQTKQLGMVQGSARHLLALINDVLDISKIEAGQLEIHAEQFDLPATLEKVTALIKPLADKRKLILRMVLSPEVGQVVGDRMRVEQVLLNLLNNAVKFTERGEIILEARLIQEYAFSNQKMPQPAVCLSVTDTGIGIKPEDMEKIFQPFRQIDSGLSRQHEGTGLGLNICRRLANLMGGEICAKSVWGEGSVFTFFLPLKPDSKP